MKNITVIIDCRSTKSDMNDFYTLSMWGKPCFEYVCDTVTKTSIFTKKYLLTDSKKIKKLASKYELEIISQLPSDDSVKMLVSGKAIFLTSETISRVASSYMGGQFCQLAQEFIPL